MLDAMHYRFNDIPRNSILMIEVTKELQERIRLNASTIIFM
jgi:hypothetical protein